ncbi:MAG: 16S rRNA (uracil(1498)-N(3))-methyltransferase [Actinomycetota bacterium]|nr:16S rRNA (uracil(1498)-N(3))-methyltransferase [Actinomycetota bacterium]
MFVADVDAPSLEERDAHHLVRVLRLRPGESISVADGVGRWRLCALASGGGQAAATLEPIADVIDEPPPRPALTVAFAPTKGDRPEWAVGKLTELGIDRIIPLVTARCVVRWDDKRGERRHGRWLEIARQSAMQCRRVRLPAIDPPTDVAEVVSGVAEAAALAVPGGDAPTLEHPVVLIGPEGGWSANEEAAVRVTVSLGPHVLRTETAALTAASIYSALRTGLVVEQPVRAAPS